ncbi:MAG: hypothetical protein JNJ46_10225 [Myxococcales bacterium]|nr:hypothetical protein [Myxococcales bacterium]
MSPERRVLSKLLPSVAGLGLILCAGGAFVRCVPPDPTDPCIDDEAACPPDAGLPVDAAAGLDADSTRDGGRDGGDRDAATAPDAGSDAGLACPSFAMGMAVGRTPLVTLTESSGVVAGRRSAGTLWLHNDSGAGPRIVALSSTGALQALYDLMGATAQDWEDIAIGPGPRAGSSYLYIGDIGDNAMARADVQVYRVEEPDVRSGSPTTPTMLPVERFTLVYPDRAHNAETLLVDPLRSDVYIVAKSGDGVSPVFRAAAPLSSAVPNRLEQVAVLRFGTAPLSGGRTTTGGDISPRGDEIAIRTYDAAFLWRRPAGMTVADALAGIPCPLPLRVEPQGEALGFASDGAGYYTVSEGSNQPLFFYSRR